MAAVIRDESYLSTRVAPVRLEPNSGEVTATSYATGLFWESKGEWYLVTNLHVLTGWHHEAGRALSPKAFTPTYVEFELAVDRSEPGEETSLIGRIGRRIPIEDNDGPVWFEHPDLGPNADVGVVPLFSTPDAECLAELGARRLLSVPVNMHGGWTEFYRPRVGDDAYVLGYPKGMSAGGFPIWKRASIATEPDIDVDKLPKTLIDTATREGMSGSPVIAVHRGICSPGEQMTGETVIGEVAKFLGVYSGRIGDDELGVQLGIVWKSQLIEEIVKGAKRGSWPWHKPGDEKPA